MGDTRGMASVRGELASICKTATIEHRVPTAIVEHAARATLEVMRREPSSSAAQMRLRTKRYFWAVVRREARRTGSRDVSARFVLKAIIDDLSASGWEPKAIWEQIDRECAQRFPRDVLEDYQRRLCA